MGEAFFLIAALLIVGGMFLLGFYLVWKRDEEEFGPANVTNLKYDPESKVLTFKGGVSGRPYKFRGDCTVWHSMSGRRLDTLMESKLYDLWDYCRYNK